MSKYLFIENCGYPIEIFIHIKLYGTLIFTELTCIYNKPENYAIAHKSVPHYNLILVPSSKCEFFVIHYMELSLYRFTGQVHSIFYSFLHRMNCH